MYSLRKFLSLKFSTYYTAAAGRSAGQTANASEYRRPQERPTFDNQLYTSGLARTLAHSLQFRTELPEPDEFSFLLLLRLSSLVVVYPAQQEQNRLCFRSNIKLPLNTIWGRSLLFYLIMDSSKFAVIRYGRGRS